MFPVSSKLINSKIPTEPTEDSEADKSDSEKLIGFARIYSGTIKVGDELYVLSPKYDPRRHTQENMESDGFVSTPFCTKITVESLYLIMGGELEPLNEVPAGNIFGIGGLDGKVLKCATLSSTIECPSFDRLGHLVRMEIAISSETFKIKCSLH
jgi:ribosome assembly protein 1